ncbi:MAG: hypothetical protein ACYTG0_30360 [Planctomycetota bacterium]
MKSRAFALVLLLSTHPLPVRRPALQCHFQVDVKDYLAQYYIGHYNPRGNHFCAFAIKDRLVEMLDPKPVPYRKDPTILP